MLAAAQESIIRLQIVRALSRETLLLGVRQIDLERIDDLPRQFVLDFEYVGEVAVEAVGPDVPAGGRIDQLGGDPYPVARLAHAAFQHIANAQLPGHLRD